MAPPLKPPFYVVSDTHFYHQRIVEYANRPHDHELMMVKRWQKTVKPTDTILHLGDLFFGGREGHARFLAELTPILPGKKFIILGNHDKKRFDYEALGFTVLKPFTLPYRGYNVSFAHYPSFPQDPKEIRVHGHIHSNGYSGGDPQRPQNINVCVEVTDYRPIRVTRLLNNYIRRNKRGDRYLNSRFRRHRGSNLRVDKRVTR